jgi:hypothetical protein
VSTWVSVGWSSPLDRVLTNRILVMGGCVTWEWWSSDNGRISVSSEVSVGLPSCLDGALTHHIRGFLTC